MTEKLGLFETSFVDAIEIIAAAKELPQQTRRHWITSLRQIAKALDKALAVIPARYSAVRADLINLHEVPAGLTAKTLAEPQEQREDGSAVVGAGKGIPAHGASLNDKWEELKTKIKDRLIRWRLSSFMRFCSANNVSPSEVDEAVVDQFMSYRLRCGKPADTAFRRLMARAWNANVGTVAGWPPSALLNRR